MRKISDIIIEEGTEDLAVQKERTTVRGIILNDDKLLMVYSHKFTDYTFPGGGVKKDEDHQTALKRELNEELGAKDLVNLRPYGYIEEKRFGLGDTKSVYLQTSYYYFVEVDGYGKQSLMERELDHGVQPTWVSIEEAIDFNRIAIATYHHHKGMKTVLPREIKVLEDLRKYLKDAKENEHIEKI